MYAYCRSLIFICSALAMVCGAATAPAEENSAPTAARPGHKEAAPRKEAYLGVTVAPLHPALWAHLLDTLEHKQGLLVTEVASGSPAEKAGIQSDDILMQYGDQKLYSPSQLLALVHTDQPGNEVKATVVHEGKQHEVTVTLGEHIVSTPTRTPHRVPFRSHGDAAVATKRPGWTNFDSMTLKSLGNDRYKVEIAYETDDGTMKNRAFEGTYDEIREDIMAQKNIPDSERQDLLKSLDLSTRSEGEDVPGVYITPDGHVLWDMGALRRF